MMKTKECDFSRTFHLVLPALAIFITMSTFETLKQFLHPYITIWQSHAVTFVFSVLIGAIAARFFSKRYLLSCRRLEEEILERKQVELTLEEEVIRRRILVDQSREGIVVLDQYGSVYESNQRFAEMLGYSAQEILELNVWDWDVQWTREQLLEAIRLDDKAGKFFETLHRRKDGTLYSAEISTNAAVFSGQKLVFCVCRDITERKRAETASRINEERLGQAARVANIGIFDHDHLTDSHYWSPKMYEIHDWDPDDPVSIAAFVNRIHPDDRKRIADNIQRAHDPANDGFFDIESRFVLRDGTTRFMTTRSQTFFEGEGDARRPVRTFGAVRDITERKQGETALRESQTRFQQLAELLPETIFEMDVCGNLTFVNRNASEYLGCSPEEFKPDLNSFGFVHPEDRPRAIENARRVMNGEKIGLNEYKVLRNDGSSFPAILHSTAKYCDGKPAGLRGIMIDVSNTKKLEAQLRRAQKMEALGTLAGGIAHDFNNILGVIMGYTEMAKLESGAGSPLTGKLDQVLKATERAKELVKQILTFSRMSEQQKRPLQLGMIVKEAMYMLRPCLPSTIEIKTDVLSTSAVLADPTQMHQVLMNLCTNAAHAMEEEGGILDVRLADVVLGTEAAVSRESLQPGRYVELTVKDNGHGVDPSIIDLIFDPFFTTKELGGGTGLGLSVVHGIVKSHGGAINVESIRGKGATFTVLIPALESESATERVDAATLLPRGHEHVLVVDDEPLLAEMVKEMLETLGYEVVSRTSGIEALEALLRKPIEKRFDLVITDQTMPHFTGVDLARELSGLQPAVPVILMTGFSFRIDFDRAKELGVQGFLMKPVSLEELAGMVRTVLDQKDEMSE